MQFSLRPNPQQASDDEMERMAQNLAMRRPAPTPGQPAAPLTAGRATPTAPPPMTATGQAMAGLGQSAQLKSPDYSVRYTAPPTVYRPMDASAPSPAAGLARATAAPTPPAGGAPVGFTAQYTAQPALNHTVDPTKAASALQAAQAQAGGPKPSMGGPVTNLGPGDTRTTEQKINDRIAELLKQGDTNSASERDGLQQFYAAQLGQSLADSRARAGFNGAALSGGQSALEGDIRNKNALEATNALTGFDRGARAEALQRLEAASGIDTQQKQLGIAQKQLGIQQEQADFQKKASQAALWSYEQDSKMDSDGDGFIGDPKQGVKATTVADRAGTLRNRGGRQSVLTDVNGAMDSGGSDRKPLLLDAGELDTVQQANWPSKTDRAGATLYQDPSTGLWYTADTGHGAMVF